MTVVERETIDDAPVHLRGSVHTLGEIVPRGFLQVVGAARTGQLPTDQSGRVEMADWIASPENPLTAGFRQSRLVLALRTGSGPHSRQFRHHG